MWQTEDLPGWDLEGQPTNRSEKNSWFCWPQTPSPPHSLQSAYTKNYFTETTLLSLHDHLSNAISRQEVLLQCLLDLSADDILIISLDIDLIQKLFVKAKRWAIVNTDYNLEELLDDCDKVLFVAPQSFKHCLYSRFPKKGNQLHTMVLRRRRHNSELPIIKTKCASNSLAKNLDFIFNCTLCFQAGLFQFLLPSLPYLWSLPYPTHHQLHHCFQSLQSFLLINDMILTIHSIMQILSPNSNFSSKFKMHYVNHTLKQSHHSHHQIF